MLSWIKELLLCIIKIRGNYIVFQVALVVTMRNSFIIKGEFQKEVIRMLTLSTGRLLFFTVPGGMV